MSVLGLAAGFLIDGLLGDPRRGHPVAGLGQAAARVELRCYADDRAHGVLAAATVIGPVLAGGLAISRITAASPLTRTLTTAAATWTVLGGTTLVREAAAIDALLAADDLGGARGRISNLVGRDPETLDADGIARACVESVAENTSDAVTAPLFWGGLLGLPGLLGYRAINTLDAMWGHRTDRYRNFGWAAARLDDLANWVPARLAALLAAAAAPVVGGRPAEALSTVRRDAAQHPSPNSGQVEAAFAGALGVRLGGVNEYQGTVEDRGVLGDGRAVGREDIARAAKLSLAVQAGSLLVAMGVRRLLR